MREGRGDEAVSPLRLAVALIRFCGTLAGVGGRLLAEAGRPDPMDLRPRVLNGPPGASGPQHPGR